ncbi:hypothetical protein ACN38_g5102 [Penicillium nordicum]|uniref:Uncharacterized protein n=1 Tax=Penicillium nordicum TaxID=229535 RepID=A0A0M9WGJ7_9EURO|nr:hypothetical protein ACN38_g5102 [Penicillium nordicum]
MLHGRTCSVKAVSSLITGALTWKHIEPMFSQKGLPFVSRSLIIYFLLYLSTSRLTSCKTSLFLSHSRVLPPLFFFSSLYNLPLDWRVTN